MICVRCAHRLPLLRSCAQTRLLSSTRPQNQADPNSISPSAATQSSPRGPPSHSHEGPPSATSTSAAQPFSTPFTPHQPPIPATYSADGTKVESSVPEGTLLKGLGYLKGRDDPVAGADSSYPIWLWSLLDQKTGGAGGAGEGEGDLYGMSPRTIRLR